MRVRTSLLPMVGVVLSLACSDTPTDPTKAPTAVDPAGDDPAADTGAVDDADPGDDTADTVDSGDETDSGEDTGTDADCPEGMVCVASFPFYESNDTRSSDTRDFDTYGCAPDTDESGPEVVYRVDLDEEGYLAVALDDWDQDVDVHILGSLDPDDCFDRGHYDAGTLLPAGRYYVVVDSWTDAGVEHAGRYDVFMGHTAYADFEHTGLDRDVLASGLSVFDAAWMWGEVDRFIYTIIDFSLPSTEPRQWTLDLAAGSLMWQLHVTHGEASGSDADLRYADSFSNIEGSHQSSLGAMVTAETYWGSNGNSLRLDGLEPGFNDAVRRRAIVVHGASYATPDFVDAYGYLGRSWGCPAVDEAITDAFIDDVKGGTLYWSWYPDDSYVAGSAYLP